MRVVVLGANGMAGHMVVRYLTYVGHDVITVARTNANYLLDVEIPSDVNVFFDNLPEVDYVINCIGLLVKDSIDRPDRAVMINSWLPHFIEHKLRKSKTRLIHLSTDCVFDGAAGNYIEIDTHTETNSYGKTKSTGEVNNEKDITFRTSIIGPELKQNGTGLFNWVMSSKDKELTGWENALWNGITTLELAKCIDQYMHTPSFSGIYHLVNNQYNTNKFELVLRIATIFNLDKSVIKGLGPKTINKILVDTRQLINFSISDYETQLTELKDFSCYVR